MIKNSVPQTASNEKTPLDLTAPPSETDAKPSLPRSRFREMSMYDPRIFGDSTLRHRCDIPRLKFDLLLEIQGNKSRFAYLRSEDKREIKLCLGQWLKQELECSISSSSRKFTVEESATVCIEKALDRFMVHNGVYRFWDELTGALTANNNQMFPDGSSDYTELGNMRSGFKVGIPGTLGEIADRGRRSYRLPPEIFNQADKVAKRIGMDLPHFIQLLIIDGVRTHPKRVYGEKMDGITADFYYLFVRRLRRLYYSVKFLWDITPSEDVERIIAEMDSSEIVA